MELIKSLLVGIACGAVFAGFGLPIPAPTVFAGILGIIGIFLGYMLIGVFK